MKRHIAAALAAAALAACVFAAIAVSVDGGGTRGFDEEILLAFREPGDRNDPVGPAWVEEMARDVTGLGGTTVLTLLTLAVVGHFLLQRKWPLAIHVAAAVAGGTAASNLLKAAFDRPRPELVAHGQQVFTASFPSGHSMVSAVVFLTLGALLAGAQKERAMRAYVMCIAVLLALAVGVSRVYLGVHWPTDVLAGWAAGAGWALLCWVAWRRRRLPGQVE